MLIYHAEPGAHTLRFRVIEALPPSLLFSNTDTAKPRPYQFRCRALQSDTGKFICYMLRDFEAGGLRFANISLSRWRDDTGVTP